MIINHNMSAMNAHRQMGINNSTLAKSLEKLSSGLAINRASDNAAGLAISEKMRGQISGLNQASTNAQDGISLIQTAEGALNETHSILQRMRELAVQSANGTYQDAVDRENIQKEVEALKTEINRIATSTHYNNIKLLDGSLSGSDVISGVIISGSIKDYAAAKYTTTGALSAVDASTITTWTGTDGANDAGTTEMIIDGKEISVNWGKYITESADRAALATKFSTTGITADNGASIAKILENAINAAIDESGTGVNHVTVSVDSSSKLVVTSGLSGSGKSQITFKADTATGAKGIGNLFFGAYTDGATAVGNVATSQAADITTVAANTFYTIINGNKISTSGPAITASSTTMSQAATALQGVLQSAITAYNTATGASLDKTAITVEADEKGGFKITNKTGADISFADIDGTKNASKLGLTKSTGLSSGKGLTFQIGANGSLDQRVSLEVGDQSSLGLGIKDVDVSTQGGANSAISVIDDAINSVSGTRADLGALQNRLEHTINSLGVASENLTAAESRIRDVDMAKEMMSFTKTQILSQAAQAMLAQANTLPQGVLQLLR